MYDSDSDQKTQCLYQAKPVNSTDFTPRPSATFSKESRRKWASRKVRELDTFHREHVEPDYFLTIDYKQPVSISAVKAYHASRVDAIRYHNRTKSYLGGIYCLEISKGNILHEHCLIRSAMSKDEVKSFFDKHCLKVNKKEGLSLACTYCEPVECSQSATRYMLKLIEDESKAPLIFKRNLGLTLTGVFGCYYGDTKTNERKREATSSYVISKLEAAIEIPS